MIKKLLIISLFIFNIYPKKYTNIVVNVKDIKNSADSKLNSILDENSENFIFSKKLKLDNESLTNYLLKNLFKIASISAVTYYGYLYYQVKKGNDAIENKSLWSNWKINFTLEKLYLLSKEELKEELKKDIQRTYQNRISIFNVNQYCIEDINIEKEALEKYINTLEKIKKLKILFLFPIKKDYLEYAHEKLRRLSFIESLIR